VEQEIIKVAATQGLWALLFVALLFWVLRENAKREDNYQQLLQELTGKFGILEEVHRDVGEVKATVNELVR
jgi:type II secretory pathway component PulM